MSSQGVAFTALVVAGGLAAVPTCALAQEPVASAVPPPPTAAPAVAPAAPAAPTAEPEAATEAVADPEPVKASPCGPSPDPEDELTPVAELQPEPEPAATASAEQPGSGPVAHCSQDAGENQYRDPFANSPPPKSQDGAEGAQAPANTSTGSATGSATLQQDDTAAALGTDAETGSGPRLPNTGLGLAGLLALGVPLLAGGLALRARAA